jgi:hypothetical protein
MWPGIYGGAGQTGVAYNWMFYQYGQDGSLPTDVTGDCNPTTYVCAMMGDGTVARVLRSDLPLLDASRWQYGASVDSLGKVTWTSTVTDRRPVMNFARDAGDYTTITEIVRPGGIIAAPAYIKEFRAYLMSAYVYHGGGLNEKLCFLTSLGPFGPWKMIGCTAQSIGSNTVNLGLGYTVLSTSPPHIQVSVATDIKTHTGGVGSPYFSKWDLVLGTPAPTGDAPMYRDTGLGRMNSGWQFTAGDVAGTFSRKGLLWAFDFMDHGGWTLDQGYPFVHDVANNSAVLYPCYTDGATVCGHVYASKGLNLLANGIQAASGYLPHWESNISDVSFGSVVGNLNAPAAMQGNGTFSVVGVFRSDGITPNVWATGDLSTGNAAVALGTSTGAGASWNVQWGGYYVGKNMYASAFTPTTGKWYYVAVTVTAGTPPTARMWVGQSGALSDVLSGVSSGTFTPSVTATPLLLGKDPTLSTNVSYGALLIYDHALSYIENAALYQTLKVKMLDRGITVQ